MSISPDPRRMDSLIPPPRTPAIHPSASPRENERAQRVWEVQIPNIPEEPPERLRPRRRRFSRLGRPAFQCVRNFLGICGFGGRADLSTQIERALRRYEATQDLDVFQDLFSLEPSISLEDFRAAAETGPHLLDGVELIHNDSGQILALREAGSPHPGFEEILFSGADLSGWERLSPKALANIINRQQLDLKESGLCDDSLADLAQYLTYCKLSQLSEDLQSQLLAQLDPQRVQQLFIKSKQIHTDELPTLPHCRELECWGCTNLTNLPKLPQCHRLDCSECDNLSSLPKLPLCQKLDCSGCPRLKALPELPKCQELDCSDCKRLMTMPAELPLCQKFHCKECSSLSALPTLPLCQELNCSSCHYLTGLPQLLECQNLDCNGCYHLTTLPQLPLCLKLDCSGCYRLESLPQLLLCRELYCKGCNGLQALTALPLCQKLHCMECSSLKKLPRLSQCEELFCWECPELKALPRLPKCLRLDCSSCPKLRALPSQLPLCQKLLCSGCRRLKALPVQLPRCQQLDCSGCRRLTDLPQALPNCVLFKYSNCPGLQNAQLPELPFGAQIVSGAARAAASWKVHYQLVDQKPKYYLDELGKNYLLAKKPFPNVYYLEPDDQLSEAVDVGGVRRDLLSRITRNLFTEEALAEHLLRVDGFPMLAGSEQSSFQTLGKVLSLCYQTSNAFTSGPLFHEDVYRALAANDEPIRRALALQSVHPSVEQILEADLDVESSVRDQARFFVDEYGENDALSSFEGFRDYFSKKAHREELRLGILTRLEQVPFSQRSRAVNLLATSMKEALGDANWKELCQLSPSELKTRIEGQLSAEAISDSLTWEAVNTPQQAIEVTQSYVINWLEHANKEELRLFVRAITSNNSLPVSETITIQLYQRGEDDVPKAHTCSSTLELSAQYANQNNFNSRFAYLIGQAEEGFQMG